jgi:cysteine desulfurase/selenocysteine lyase
MNAIDPIDKFRSSFFPSEQFLHFNNAGVAPISKPAFDAIAHWSRRFYEEGFHAIPEAMKESEKTRETLARLLGADTDEIGYFQNASTGLSQVAFGLKFEPGDEIVVWDQEYPANFHPWRLACERSGAKLIQAKSGPNFEAPLSSIEAVLTPRTKVIAFSWVQYRTGAINDIKAITDLARSRGILTCSDIIQGAGLLPFNFHESGLDFASGGSHKWLVSPSSTGYLLTRRDRLPLLQPLLVGAMTFGGPNSLTTGFPDMPNAGTKFEPGSRAFLELIAFGASLKMIEEVGVARIGQEVEWLSKRLMHGLREIGYTVHSPHGSHHRGSIVNFTPSATSAIKNVDDITKRLTEAGVIGNRRPPGQRLAPHAFNTKEQIDRILSILSK